MLSVEILLYEILVLLWRGNRDEYAVSGVLVPQHERAPYGFTNEERKVTKEESKNNYA